MTIFHATQQIGFWNDERGTNMLDTGSHWYDAYETSDGKWISIGSFEPKFYALLLEKLDLDPAEWPQMEQERWPEFTEKIGAIFKRKTRDEWCEILEGTDVCFAPVLTIAESREHPHAKARGSFVEIEGVPQPRPAPRFSRTDSQIQRPPASAGEHTEEVLLEAGFTSTEVAKLKEDGAIV